ncbi:MAG: nucleotide sugar dehydrogenase [Alphaproteobacteria bacterium]|nr:nucleotide sugar dehydrogenase [Alphaproteobacteria bacterium]
MNSEGPVVVVGLGYVGLPLAVALAKHGAVLGFDISGERIAELNRGYDRTAAVPSEALSSSALVFTDDPAKIEGRGILIVTVPTPVGADNRPDLSAVLAASETVGRALKPGAIVVYESTVYPGVTEDICGPALERASGLQCGKDFFLGYSPERVNPGDREHTIDRITKVVAGQTPEVVDRLAAIYGAVNGGDIYRAQDIRTAEAAKVIENAQRDINIAFVNEVAMILGSLGLNSQDVLDAANTKWNFLPFRPGLVGGHCIGVDPYYLAHAAEQAGHHPEIVLAGRRINDGVGAYAASRIDAVMSRTGGRVLVLGLTFKENVPDLRNSKVIDIISALIERGHHVDVHDPHADARDAMTQYGIDLLTNLDGAGGYDAVVGAVQHHVYEAFEADDLLRLVVTDAVVADIKGMWRELKLPPEVRRWQL